jgi:hypothetical protein
VSEILSVGHQDEHAAPERLALCDKPAEEVHQDKVILYNMLGDYATMIHKGEHIASKVYTTNKENHRIDVWPCGTTCTCTEGWLDVDQEDDEADGNADYEGEEEQADDGEEEEEKAPKKGSIMQNPGCIMKQPNSIIKKPRSVMKVLNPIMKKPSGCIDYQCQKFKTTHRHREHSKKYHQGYKELQRSGKPPEVARKAAQHAARKHVKGLFGA